MYNPERIVQARKARNCSQQKLGEKCDISKQMLSKYETGKTELNEIMINKVARFLDFPIEFFLKDSIVYDENIPIFFRSNRISKKTEDYKKYKIFFIDEIVNYLENFINLPKYTDFNTCNDFIDMDEELYCNEIELLTKKIRKSWGIGNKPINKLTYLLSKNGYIVSENYDLGNKSKIDGYSMLYNDRPVIILDNKTSAVRTRFSLAHELGHMIMHKDVSIDDKKDSELNKKLEAQANRFASSLLLPDDAFVDDLQNLTIEGFIPLKKKWKVSISAIIRRCYDLDIINDTKYSNLNKSMSFKGYRITEPLDNLIPHEKISLFKEGFELIYRHKLDSVENTIKKIGLYDKDIEELCSLENGFFHNHSERPLLRIVK